MPRYKTPLDDLILYETDVRKMFAACDGLQYRALLSGIWLTGARVGELLRLRPYNVRIDPERLKIELFTEKLGRKYKDPKKNDNRFKLHSRRIVFRIVPDTPDYLYTSTFCRYVKEFTGNRDDFLFPIHVRQVQRWINALSLKTYGQEIAVHTFRHSVLTHLGSSGKIGEKELATFKGSNDIGSVRGYLKKREFEVDYSAINRDYYDADNSRAFDEAVRFIAEPSSLNEPGEPEKREVARNEQPAIVPAQAAPAPAVVEKPAPQPAPSLPQPIAGAGTLETTAQPEKPKPKTEPVEPSVADMIETGSG